jgi:hypothetical protein
MKASQLQFQNGNWKSIRITNGFDQNEAQLVLAFGAASLVAQSPYFEHLRVLYPKACIVMGSTAGEIIGNTVSDNSIVVTALQFDSTVVKCVCTNIEEHQNSFETGAYLMAKLAAEDLASVFILSDGTFINGSDLLVGINEKNIQHVPVTGGMAGDGTNFLQTFVGLNEIPIRGNVVAIGLYGTSIKIGHSSFGGWDEFGPEKKVTKSEKNVLYEIDGKNALDLYKMYLGPYEAQLPGSVLLFPLSLKEPGQHSAVVRTILTIDTDNKSMTFAGNMPEGSTVRLMKASFDKLIHGSSVAASQTLAGNQMPQLAILVSCVGRKLILQDRTEEEVEAANSIFGDTVFTTGFYSYGEISPLGNANTSELHNQTMTMTTLSEV